MNANEETPTADDIRALRYIVLRACKIKQEPTKTDLSRSANKAQMPSAWIHNVTQDLITEGLIIARVKNQLAKRGPNPECYKITEKGCEAYSRLISE